MQKPHRYSLFDRDSVTRTVLRSVFLIAKGIVVFVTACVAADRGLIAHEHIGAFFGQVYCFVFPATMTGVITGGVLLSELPLVGIQAAVLLELTDWYEQRTRQPDPWSETESEGTSQRRA